ncbi:vWA domain-containing protein [Chondrinema litorale]|uniref:vWA domain-containing protein n=1 Tax=Chondrinema litorale TaxID=2994555 RepID=UPI00254378D5|nr:VWA domain-containing protein [Chondrinema litorale]UZR92825.1 VWA domain-containing protein [Chondrinema litorale]
MFRFENQEFLYALFLLPVMLVFFWFSGRKRKKALKRMGEMEVIQGLMPELSFTRPIIKNAFLILAFIFLVFAMANPQIGSKLETVKRKGVEIMIAIDVSNSMLAEDIKPNRLERARRAISQLVKKLHNDKIGLVVFAGDAYIQLPITTDYAAARMFLQSVNTKIVPIQGTAIGKAIELSMGSFTSDQTKNKALIIITDGENHEDDAITMASKAAEEGVIVHTIGMGLPQGGPIPVYNQYGQKDYRKDNTGNVVVTKLNENMLQQVAAAGNGLYVRANNAETGLDMLYDKINEMDKEEFESKVFADYEDRFQPLVLLAIVCLLIEFIILPRKNKILNKINLFKYRI